MLIYRTGLLSIGPLCCHFLSGLWTFGQNLHSYYIYSGLIYKIRTLLQRVLGYSHVMFCCPRLYSRLLYLRGALADAANWDSAKLMVPSRINTDKIKVHSNL
jgi:hypothetical protein